MKPIIFKIRKGFTLVELLVSIAIFVIFLGIVSVSYIGIVRSQRQANEVRKMYSDVRTFVESLSQDMRLGTVDYDCYGDPVTSKVADCPPFSNTVTPGSPTSDGSYPYLAIVNKDKSQKVIYWFDKDSSQIKMIRYQNTNPGDKTDVPTWSVISGYENGLVLLSDLVRVNSLTFSVNPPVNQYAAENYVSNQFQFQPQVRLAMTTVNSDKTVTPFHLDFQTSLSSRVYSRTK